MAFNNPRPAQRGKTGNPATGGLPSGNTQPGESSPRPGGTSGDPDRTPGDAGGALGSLVKAEKMMQIAFVLPVAVLVGWGAGVAFDRWLHVDWLYIAGIILGAAAGFVQIFRLVLAPERER